MANILLAFPGMSTGRITNRSLAEEFLVLLQFATARRRGGGRPTRPGLLVEENT
jgi:hypothetical protein